MSNDSPGDSWPCHTFDDVPLPSTAEVAQAVGLVTRTQAQSPFIRFSFVASLIHSTQQNLVLIGDDFIQVRQIDDNYHTRIVATLSHPQLSSGIRAARILTLSPDERLYRRAFEVPIDVPQAIVLTLQSGDLCLVWCLSSDGGKAACQVHNIPSPQSLDFLHQLGKHLTVDPRGRFILTAALERNICLLRFPHISSLDINHDFTSRSNWSSFDKIVHMTVSGSIVHTEFLCSGSEETAAVIIISSNENDYRLLFQEWNISSEVLSGQSWDAHFLSSEIGKILFIIPLKSSYSCLFVTMTEVILCFNINIKPQFKPVTISGNLTPLRPIVCPSVPIWTAWCWNVDRFSLDTSITDGDIYLGREDGLVACLRVPLNGPITGSVIDNLGCPIGATITSFSPLWTQTDGHDIVLIPPTTGMGVMFRVSKSENLMSSSHVEFLETFPGWCPIIDATSVRSDLTPFSKATSNKPNTTNWLSQSRIEPQARIFAACGRQPYGAVVELQFGLEFRIGSIIRGQMFQYSYGLWAFQDVRQGHHYLIVSNPQGSSLLKLDPVITNSTSLTFSFVDQFDPNVCTLAAGQLGNHHFAQITQDCIRIFQFDRDLKCHHVQPVESEHAISAATIHSATGTIAVALQSGSVTSVAVSWYELFEEGTVKRVHFAHTVFGPHKEVIAISLESFHNQLLLICSLANGEMLFLSPCRGSHSILQVGAVPLVESSPCFASQRAAHSFSLINPQLPNPFFKFKQAILVASLRDGRILALFITVSSEGENSLSVRVDSTKTWSLFSYPAKITKASPESALISNETVLLRVSSRFGSELEFQSIYLTDISYPERPQSSFYPICVLPGSSEDDDPYSGAVACVSDSQLFIGNIDLQLKPVPRRIRLPGSPRRVFYSSHLKVLIAGSLCVEESPDGGFETKSGVVPRGAVYAISPNVSAENSSCPEGAKNGLFDRSSSPPLIANMFSSKRDLIHTSPHETESNSEDPSTLGFFHLWPGERIFSLKEWVVRTGKGKDKCLILLGTRHTTQPDGSGNTAGRLLILHARRTSEGKVIFNMVKKVTHTSPVYSVDTFGNNGIIYTVGLQIKILALSLETKSLIPFQTLESRSVPFNVSVKVPFAYVSTANESTFVYLLPDLSKAQDGALYPQSAEKSELFYTDVSPRDSATHFPIQLDPRRRYALVTGHPSVSDRMLLVADKARTMTGLWEPLPGADRPQIAAELGFRAMVQRTISTIIQCQTRRPWYPRTFFPNTSPDREEYQAQYPTPIPALGIISDGIIGFSVDGTIIGMSVVDQTGWLFLKTVERILQCGRQIRRLVQVARDNEEHPQPHVNPIVAEKEKEILTALATLDPRHDQYGMRSRMGYHIDGNVIAQLETAEGILGFIQALSFDGLEGSKRLSEYYAAEWERFRDRPGVDLSAYEDDPAESMLACLQHVRPPIGILSAVRTLPQSPAPADQHINGCGVTNAQPNVNADSSLAEKPARGSAISPSAPLSSNGGSNPESLESVRDAVCTRTPFLWSVLAPFISRADLEERKSRERDGEVYELVELVTRLVRPMVPNLYGCDHPVW